MVDPSNVKRKRSTLFFGTLFVLTLVLLVRIVWPFLLPVLLGAIVAVLFTPLQDFIFKHLRGLPRLSAALSTVAVFLLILLPLSALVFFVARESLGALNGLRQAIQDPGFRQEVAQKVPEFLRQHLPFERLQAEAANALLKAAAGSASLVGGILSQGTELLIDLFLMVVALYYFFLDGRGLVRQLVQLLPMDERYSRALVQEFKAVTYAIMWGHALTALVQAMLGTVGMALAGVSSPLLWGTAMMVAAVIPVGGTALIWVPVSIGLLLTHHVRAGLFLLAWGTLLVSTVDNIVRPQVTGSRMQMHPLLVFVAMFGGLSVFGVMGLVVGPLVAGLAMAMVRIYRRDFQAGSLDAGRP